MKISLKKSWILLKKNNNSPFKISNAVMISGIAIDDKKVGEITDFLKRFRSTNRIILVDEQTSKLHRQAVDIVVPIPTSLNLKT